MPTTTTVADITREILAVLRNSPDVYWTDVSLIAEVTKNLQYNNKTRVRVVLESLYTSGKLTGTYFGYGRKRALGSLAINQDSVTDKERAAEVEEKLRELTSDFVALTGDLAETKQLLAEEREKGTILELSVTTTRARKKSVKKHKGFFHAKFETIFTLCKARMNVLLYGPTGSGKSFICEQVAKALGLPFSFVSCTAGMSEGVLGGRLLPVGEAGKFEYVMSEFINAYENGGVFLLDEIDAADPNVLLLINAALANGRISLPNRQDKPYAERHEDFICIAAANTVGTGADRQYSGRNKLDASTLDRFQIGKVIVEYDKSVERNLCPDDELLKWLYAIREGIRANRLERAMSTRFIKDAYKMKSEFEWSYEQIEEAFFQGWREDERGKVHAPIPKKKVHTVEVDDIKVPVIEE